MQQNLAESTKPNTFWFNPNLFFNGDRITFVHEYRRKLLENASDARVTAVEAQIDEITARAKETPYRGEKTP